jgi:acetyl esterase/lipase
MPKFDSKKLGAIDFDITYSIIDGISLGMDIYYPGSGGAWPALIFIHGGGWTEGDKAGIVVNASQFGYLTASINYRLYPAFRFPAMIEDVKCAIRYLRAHAQQYNLDPNRIGLIGHSAGSHLAALAGLADQNAGWDIGPYLNHSSQVQAVIVVSGPTDLSQEFPDWVQELKGNVFGFDKLTASSPVTYAHAGAPPFFIVHGDSDEAVPVEQAHLLYDALNKVQSPVELLIIQNCSHGLESLGGKMNPTMEIVFQKAFEFLDSHLLFTGKIRPPKFAQKWLTRVRLLARLIIRKFQSQTTP